MSASLTWNTGILSKNCHCEVVNILIMAELDWTGSASIIWHAVAKMNTLLSFGLMFPKLLNCKSLARKVKASVHRLLCTKTTACGLDRYNTDRHGGEMKARRVASMWNVPFHSETSCVSWATLACSLSRKSSKGTTINWKKNRERNINKLYNYKCSTHDPIFWFLTPHCKCDQNLPLSRDHESDIPSDFV